MNLIGRESRTRIPIPDNYHAVMHFCRTLVCALATALASALLYGVDFYIPSHSLAQQQKYSATTFVPCSL